MKLVMVTLILLGILPCINYKQKAEGNFIMMSGGLAEIVKIKQHIIFMISMVSCQKGPTRYAYASR